MRVILGCLAAVTVGFVGGVILGEYRLTGVMALLAGLLFGLALAEAAITAGRSSGWVLVGVTAASSFAGFTWAAWIEVGRDFGPIEPVRWIGAVIALVASGWWVRALGSRPVRSLLFEESEESAPTP